MSVLLGSKNNDQLQGEDSDDLIKGRRGDDVLSGGGGKDTLRGGKGADTLNGGLGDDRIYAARGDDVIEMSAGQDVLRGGDGLDTLVVTGAAGSTQWRDFTQGEDKIALSITAELFPYLVEIQQGEGAAELTFGDSTIALRDVDAAALTADDFIFVEPAFNEIVATGGRLVATDDFNDKVIGSDIRDDIYGKAGDDLLLGNGGSDWLNGSYGDDTLLGGTGDDRLWGAVGSDLLIGGDGNDSLQPGPTTGDGPDIVFGGSGADVVDLYTYSNPDWASDVIWQDFEDGIDLIDISGLTQDTFADRVSVTDHGAGALVSLDGISLLLNGVTADQITMDDFLF